MPEVALGLSVAEQDKIAAYHKAMEDRQIGVVNVAESVPADGGMAVTGEVPPGAMEPDQPMESLVAGLAPSAMPRPAMNAAATGESGVAVNEMPRPPMN